MGDLQKLLEQRNKVNLADWRIAETSLPLTIHWHFPKQRSEELSFPALACNGIFVSNAASLPQITYSHCREDQNHWGRYWVKTPRLHITDFDGHLALGLTRKEVVNDEYGFERDLYVSVMKDFFARLFVEFPEMLEPTQFKSFSDGSPFTRGARLYSEEAPDFLFSEKGFCIPFKRAISSRSRPMQHLLWIKGSTDALGLVQNLGAWDCVIMQGGLFFSKLEGSFGEGSHYKCISKLLKAGGEGFAIQQLRFTDNSAEKRPRVKPGSNDDGELMPGIKENWYQWRTTPEYNEPGGRRRKNRWLIESLEMSASKYPFESLLTKPMHNRFEIPFVAEFILHKPWSESLDDGLLDHWWKKFFGEEWLPWKKSERRQRFPGAFKELAPYIARYEK